MAKIASGLAKPAGVLMVRGGEEERRFAPLVAPELRRPRRIGGVGLGERAELLGPAQPSGAAAAAADADDELPERVLRGSQPGLVGGGVSEGGGAGTIATFAPAGLSLDGPAHVFHRALMNEIVNGGHGRLGDAVLAAQQVYALSGQMPELLGVYHLLADPGMRIRP